MRASPPQPGGGSVFEGFRVERAKHPIERVMRRKAVGQLVAFVALAARVIDRDEHLSGGIVVLPSWVLYKRQATQNTMA